MSRKALAIVVGVGGFIIASLSLVALLIMGSLFADARTENITGPGVDVFLRTPFSGERATVVLEVEARGGSRAGISSVTVAYSTPAGRRVLAKVAGEGVTWGHKIRTGKGSRGSETVMVELAAPAELAAGKTLELQIDVAYTVAMSANGGFENQTRNDTVLLDVKIYSDSGRTLARLLHVAIALGLFGIWFGIVWWVTALYVRLGILQPGNASESEGIGLLMGLIGGTILGYWVFALRIMNVLETQATTWAVVLTVAWVGLPLLWAGRWAHRQDDKQLEVDAAELAVVFPITRGTLDKPDPMNDAMHDATLSTSKLLETARARLQALGDATSELSPVERWIDDQLAASAFARPDPLLRRRVAALAWTLSVARPALARVSDAGRRAARDDLLAAIRDVPAITDEVEREAIAARVLRAVETVSNEDEPE